MTWLSRPPPGPRACLALHHLTPSIGPAWGDVQLHPGLQTQLHRNLSIQRSPKHPKGTHGRRAETPAQLSPPPTYPESSQGLTLTLRLRPLDCPQCSLTLHPTPALCHLQAFALAEPGASGNHKQSLETLGQGRPEQALGLHKSRRAVSAPHSSRSDTISPSRAGKGQAARALRASGPLTL